MKTNELPEEFKDKMDTYIRLQQVYFLPPIETISLKELNRIGKTNFYCPGTISAIENHNHVECRNSMLGVDEIHVLVDIYVFEKLGKQLFFDKPVNLAWYVSFTYFFDATLHNKLYHKKDTVYSKLFKPDELKKTEIIRLPNNIHLFSNKKQAKTENTKTFIALKKMQDDLRGTKLVRENIPVIGKKVRELKSRMFSNLKQKATNAKELKEIFASCSRRCEYLYTEMKLESSTATLPYQIPNEMTNIETLFCELYPGLSFSLEEYEQLFNEVERQARAYAFVSEELKKGIQNQAEFLSQYLTFFDCKPNHFKQESPIHRFFHTHIDLVLSDPECKTMLLAGAVLFIVSNGAPHPREISFTEPLIEEMTNLQFSHLIQATFQNIEINEIIDKNELKIALQKKLPYVLFRRVIGAFPKEKSAEFFKYFDYPLTLQTILRVVAKVVDEYYDGSPEITTENALDYVDCFYSMTDHNHLSNLASYIRAKQSMYERWKKLCNSKDFKEMSDVLCFFSPSIHVISEITEDEMHSYANTVTKLVYVLGSKSTTKKIAWAILGFYRIASYEEFQKFESIASAISIQLLKGQCDLVTGLKLTEMMNETKHARTENKVKIGISKGLTIWLAIDGYNLVMPADFPDTTALSASITLERDTKIRAMEQDYAVNCCNMSEVQATFWKIELEKKSKECREECVEKMEKMRLDATFLAKNNHNIGLWTSEKVVNAPGFD